MECRLCHRIDSVYCNKCTTNRLAEHITLRQQLRASSLIAHNKATNLLSPPNLSDAFGVKLERELKADKFSLAVRLRDVRVGLETGANQVAHERERLTDQRQRLIQRRANLDHAHQLLLSLSTDSAQQQISAPDSLQSLTSQLSSLRDRHHLLLSRIEAAQNILIREVLSVYGFSRSERPLPSPFKSSTSSSSSSGLSDHSDHLIVAVVSYRLAQLPIPSLADLATLSPTLLAASLSHLLHLTRLLALYLSVRLPFTPLPSLFGPGRPGMRATPGYGNTTTPAIYPLFPSRTSRSKSKGKDRASVFTLGVGGGEQSGGREHEGAMREVERREERMKAVVGGALALSFDLAYIATKTGRQVGEHELGDVGALLASAVGMGVTTDARRIRLDPYSLAAQTPFDLDFDTLLTAQSTPSTLRLHRTRKGQAEWESEDEWDFV